MQVSNLPANKFSIPWGNSAGGGFIRTIPTPSQIGIHDGYASLTDGFPPLTFDPVGSGGVPPFGQDMNGILFETTSWSRWQQAGGPIFYDGTFSSAIGGYPKGTVLTKATNDGKYWLSTVDNNTSDPDTGGANWTALLPLDVALLDAANVFTASPQTVQQTGAWGSWAMVRNGIGTWAIIGDTTTNHFQIRLNGSQVFDLNTAGAVTFGDAPNTRLNNNIQTHGVVLDNIIALGNATAGDFPMFNGTSSGINAGSFGTGLGIISSVVSVLYGTTSGTAAQGNDSRIVNAVPNTTTVTGTGGLAGGGALSSNQTIHVSRHITADFTFAASGSGSEAHGLSSPLKISGYMRCKTAQLGYSINDVVVAPIGQDTTTDRGFSYGFDGTNAFFSVGSGGVSLTPKGGGAPNAITAADWVIYLVVEE